MPSRRSSQEEHTLDRNGRLATGRSSLANLAIKLRIDKQVGATQCLSGYGLPFFRMRVKKQLASSGGRLLIAAWLLLLLPGVSPAQVYNITDLGTLGGKNSFALGINALGQVIGASDTAAGQSHAFLWTKAGGMQDLGTLGGSVSKAFGINASGQVVGWSAIADKSVHAFLWTKGSGMRDLGTLKGRSSYAVDRKSVV